MLTVNLIKAQSIDGALHTFKCYIVPKDTVSNKDIPFADVMMVNGNTNFGGQTDYTGNYLTSKAFAGIWDFYAGHWGYITGHLSAYIDSIDDVAFVKLKSGYYDDFLFINNWRTSNVHSISWERVKAIDTLNNSLYPKTDDSTDIGSLYVQTGPFGKPLDTGVLLLSSPLIDLSAYKNPVLYFSLFSACNKNLKGLDSIKVYSVSATDTNLLLTIPTTDSVATWRQYSVNISSTFTADTGHILYKGISHSGKFVAGLDKFYITGNTSGAGDVLRAPPKLCPTIFFNRSNQSLSFTFNTLEPLKVELYNVAGKLLYMNPLSQRHFTLPVNKLSPGVYLIKTIGTNGVCVKTTDTTR